MWYSTLECIVTLTLCMLAVPLVSEAQQATQVHRIGFLHPGSPLPEPPSLETLRQGMRALGYSEGQNIMRRGGPAGRCGERVLGRSPGRGS